MTRLALDRGDALAETLRCQQLPARVIRPGRLAKAGGCGFHPQLSSSNHSFHQFQVLTKRADRMRALVSSWRADDMYDFWYAFNDGAREVQAWPLPNVRVGVSIENQPMADKRFPTICALGEMGWNTMVSLEPLLGPVRIPDRYLALGSRAWCIPGGESGRFPRRFNWRWAYSIIRQCNGAGVACFMKQLGANAEVQQGCGDCDPCIGQQPCSLSYDILATLRNRKGGDPAEWAPYLRVRQFPEALG